MSSAGAVLALFPVGAALAADRQDYGTEGVTVSVLITPLQACVGACAGGGGAGGGAGSGGLPQTGGTFPLALFWIAAALLAVGLIFVLWQRTRPVGLEALVAGRRTPFGRISGRPAMTTDAESARADRSVAPDSASAPDGERGDPQCRRM
jgi:LPXTG-motif cell wall-anchored protein